MSGSYEQCPVVFNENIRKLRDDPEFELTYMSTEKYVDFVYQSGVDSTDGVAYYASEPDASGSIMFNKNRYITPEDVINGYTDFRYTRVIWITNKIDMKDNH